MACPFFLPTQRCDAPMWPHPGRLPLGDAWKGRCTAGCGSDVSSAVEPGEQELKHGCNLGYAGHCPRLPAERSADAVRFGVARDRENRIAVLYVYELANRPAGHGTLEYDVAGRRWLQAHSDLRIQRMAECYLDAYLRRRNGLD